MTYVLHLPAYIHIADYYRLYIFIFYVEGSASNDVNIHKIISQPNISIDSLIALALNLTPTTTDPILSSSPSIIPLAVFIPVVLVLLGTISLVVIVILVLR